MGEKRDIPQGRSEGVFQRYCSSVCCLIRWRPARGAVARELYGHLDDHASALAEQGVPWETAAGRAVNAMGNPYALGLALDRLHSPFWHRVALGIALLALVLLAWLAALGRLDNGDLFPSWGELPLWADEEAVLLEDDWRRQVTAAAARGSADGGGRLGDYTLRPGQAAVVRLEDEETGETEYALRVCYTVSHLPWLRPLDLQAADFTAADSLGGTYSEEVGWQAAHASRPWAEQCCFTLDDPALGAEKFTLSVEAPNGERVAFTVSLDWEGAYGADQ